MIIRRRAMRLWSQPEIIQTSDSRPTRVQKEYLAMKLKAKPSFNPVYKGFPVKANNAREFLDGIVKYFRARRYGRTSDDAQFSADAKEVTLKLVITVETPNSQNGGKTSADQKKVIDKAQDMIEKHEEKHVVIRKTVWGKFCQDVTRAPSAEKAKKLFEAASLDVDKKDKALDSREGSLGTKEDTDGNVLDVSYGAAR